MRTLLVDSMLQLKQLHREIRKARSFSYDTEATGLHPIKDRITLHIITLPNEVTYVIPVRMCTLPNLDPKKVARYLGPLFKSKKVTKNFWNAKIDWHFLTNDGIKLNNYYDAMVAGWMLDENELKSLKHRAKEVGIEDHTKFSWKTYFTARRKFEEGELTPKGLSDLQAMELAMVDYAAKDGVATHRLAKKYKEELEKEPVLNNVFNKVWQPGIEMLYHMERRGMCVDINRMRRARIACRKRIAKCEAEIYREAGQVFNIGSTQQLAEVLYEDLGVPVIATTKKGAPATDKDTISLLSMQGATSAPYGTPDFIPRFPIMKHLLEYRKYSKLFGTYLKEDSTMGERIHKGRVHTSYNIVGTDTGRQASSGPNLQNLPRPDQDNLELSVRHLIVAPRGYDLLVADFSQFELRVISDVTQDEGMLEVYRSGGDIHSKTQSGLDVVRTIAKNLNFGTFYDIQEAKFAMMLTVSTGKHVTNEEARRLIDGMFNLYPGVPRYKRKLIAKCRKNGYITTYLGRRRRLPDINSYTPWMRRRAERQAFNARVQGSVADIMNLCMLRAHRDKFLRSLGIKMVGQVHDEVHFIIPKRHSIEGGIGYEKMVEHLKGIFEHPFKQELSVPILFNCEPLAHSWGEAK